MQTAEQIALSFGLCTCDEIYTSRRLTAPDCPWHAFAVEEAMIEYAKAACEEQKEICKRDYMSAPFLGEAAIMGCELPDLK